VEEEAHASTEAQAPEDAREEQVVRAKKIKNVKRQKKSSKLQKIKKIFKTTKDKTNMGVFQRTSRQSEMIENVYCAFEDIGWTVACTDGHSFCGM